MADLEQQIGELKGILKPLARTAEKISERVEENRVSVTAVETDLGGHKKEVWHAVRELEKEAKEDKLAAENAVKEARKAAGEDAKKIAALERDVQQLTARSSGMGKFLLRVAEMAIAAGIGAAAVKVFGG